MADFSKQSKELFQRYLRCLILVPVPLGGNIMLCNLNTLQTIIFVFMEKGLI